MPQCLVKNCGNYYGKNKRAGKKIIYHLLPSNPRLHAKWLELCTNNAKTPKTGHGRVCSDHFSEICYQRDLQHELLGLPLRKKLKPDALPDRNLPPGTTKRRKSLLMKHGLKSKLIHEINENFNTSSSCGYKLPMRSSIRIAKKKSVESLSDSFTEKVKKRAHIKPGPENFSAKLKFMARLQLKLEKNDNFKATSPPLAVSLPKYDLRLSLGKIQQQQEKLSASLTKMQIMEDVREGCSVQPSSPGHAEERLDTEEPTKPATTEHEENGFEEEEEPEEEENSTSATHNASVGDHEEEEEPSSVPLDLKPEPAEPDAPKPAQEQEEEEDEEKPSVEVENGENKVVENNTETVNHVNEESYSNTSSEETISSKRKSESLQQDNSNSTSKRLRIDIQENFISRDKILNDFIEISECNSVEQMQLQTEQILAEIRTLSELAKEKEREWNNIIHLKKMKEELLLRMQRRKQVMLLSDKSENGEVLFSESQNDSAVGERLKPNNQSILKTNLSNPNKTLRMSSGSDKGKQQRSILPKPANYAQEMNGDYRQNKQRPVLDVQSIIADYRQRHPETVPRRGRRIRNSQHDSKHSPGGVLNFSSLALGSGSQVHHNMQGIDVNSELGLLLNAMDANRNDCSRPSSAESSTAHVTEPCFKDMLVQFAKLSQSERHELIQNAIKPPPPYPEVTVHPVPTTTAAAPTNSLLHGILTKSPSKANSKTSFSPTLARLLTAPERSNSHSPTGNVIANNLANSANMSISEILSTSKARNEITITPVGTQYEPPLKNKSMSHVMEEDEAEDSADRLVIDESTEVLEGRGRGASGGGDNSSDAGDEVPQCQGCKEKSALFVCAGCGNQWYCSRDCQVSAWDEHSEVCSG